MGEFEELTLLAVRALGDRTYGVPVQQFIERGSAEGLDASCLGRLKRPPFFLTPSGGSTVSGLGEDGQ